jgi:CBS domain containing-hemolysin-like protein
LREPASAEVDRCLLLLDFGHIGVLCWSDNAFFVAAEFSLVTVRWTRVEELVEEKKFGSLAVRYAVENLDDSIAATQLGITFASLALGWVGEPTVAHLIEPMFAGMPAWWSAAATHGTAIGIAFLGITFMHVVLGELAPKAIALERAEDVARGAPRCCGRIFRPFIRFMNGSGNMVVRWLRLPPLSATAHVHSVDELRRLVEETEEAGIIPADQATYVQNVFRLSDSVRDVMIARQGVACCPGVADEISRPRASLHAHAGVANPTTSWAS